MKIHRQFFHLEKSAKNLGTVTIGRMARKPHLIKIGKKFHRDTPNHVPFVVLGLSTSSSSSSTCPTSSSQETVTDTEIPARRRSESTRELAWVNPSHESAEIYNPNKKDNDEELQSDELQGVPDWQQEFKHGLVDESVPEH